MLCDAVSPFLGENMTSHDERQPISPIQRLWTPYKWRPYRLASDIFVRTAREFFFFFFWRCEAGKTARPFQFNGILLYKIKRFFNNFIYKINFFIKIINSFLKMTFFHSAFEKQNKHFSSIIYPIEPQIQLYINCYWVVLCAFSDFQYSRITK